MSFLNSSVSFTRFRLEECVPGHMWERVPLLLTQFAFRDIDDLPEEKAHGWVSFDNMRDSAWHGATPDKGQYLCFSLRHDVRRIPAGIIKKHWDIALDKERERNVEQGRKFISRERKGELRDQVLYRLRARFLPVPAVFQVVWDTAAGTLWLASTQGNILDMFEEYFLLSFGQHLGRLDPYRLGISLLGNDAAHRLENLEPATFATGPLPSGGIFGGLPGVALGQEFLTWLWFRSEEAPGSFVDATGLPFVVSLEQHMVVQSGVGDAMETASVSGVLSPLREARYGLATGKKVARAFIRLEQDALAWSFGYRAGEAGFSSFKAPAVERDAEDDADALLLEKLYLLERGVALYDAAYAVFVKLRLSAAWGDEVEKVKQWVVG